MTLPIVTMILKKPMGSIYNMIENTPNSGIDELTEVFKTVGIDLQLYARQTVQKYINPRTDDFTDNMHIFEMFVSNFRNIAERENLFLRLGKNKFIKMMHKAQELGFVLTENEMQPVAIKFEYYDLVFLFIEGESISDYRTFLNSNNVDDERYYIVHVNGTITSRARYNTTYSIYDLIEVIRKMPIDVMKMNVIEVLAEKYLGTEYKYVFNQYSKTITRRMLIHYLKQLEFAAKNFDSINY